MTGSRTVEINPRDAMIRDPIFGGWAQERLAFRSSPTLQLSANSSRGHIPDHRAELPLAALPMLTVR